MQISPEKRKPETEGTRVEEFKGQLHPLNRTCLQEPSPDEVWSRLERTVFAGIVVARDQSGIPGRAVNHKVPTPLVGNMT